MKRYKRIAVLVGVLAAVCIATFTLSRYKKKQEEIQATAAIILEIAADSVDSIEWELEDESLSFTKGEEGWLYDEDEDFPVSEEILGDILTNFETFSASFIIENPEDYSQYGLENPEGTISIGVEDETFEIKLGGYSTMDEQRYVDIGDGNVYLVSSDPVDYLTTELSGIIRHDNTPIFENVTKVVFSGAEKFTVTREETTHSYSEDDIYFTERNGQMLPLDTVLMDGYLDTISEMTFIDYVTYNATEEELQIYGMDKPVLSAKVSYTYTDEDDKETAGSCTVHISQNPEELKAYEEAEANGDEELPDVTKYIRVGDSQIVYRLNDVDYEILSGGTYNELRHDELFWADFDLVTQIDVTLEGESHSFTSVLGSEDNKDDELRHWFYNGEEVDVYSIQSAIQSLKANSFTNDASSGKQEIAITLHMDHEDYPTVSIKLYRSDGSLCLAVVDGEATAFVERSDTMTLVEAVQEIVLN